MKRDMNLIKYLLSQIEECPAMRGYRPLVDSIPEDLRPTQEELILHCRLIAERGLAVGTEIDTRWIFTRLTWDGHDFLDNARNDSVWKAAMDAAGHFSFGVFTATLAEAAKAAALKALEKVF